MRNKAKRLFLCGVLPWLLAAADAPSPLDEQQRKAMYQSTLTHCLQTAPNDPFFKTQKLIHKTDIAERYCVCVAHAAPAAVTESDVKFQRNHGVMAPRLEIALKNSHRDCLNQVQSAVKAEQKMGGEESAFDMVQMKAVYDGMLKICLDNITNDVYFITQNELLKADMGTPYCECVAGSAGKLFNAQDMEYLKNFGKMSPKLEMAFADNSKTCMAQAKATAVSAAKE